MKDLFYRPDLKPKRDYMSDAELEALEEELPDEPTDGGDEDPSFDPLEDLKKKIDEIISVIDILPDDIEEAMLPSLRRIRRNIYDIKPPSKWPGSGGDSDNVPPRDGLEVRPPSDTDGGDGGRRIPSILPKNEAIPVIVKPPAPLRVVMEDTFQIDKTEIYRDFVHKFRLVLEKYMRELLYVADRGGFPNYSDLFYNYHVPARELPDDYKHIGDGIIRNQIQRGQKAKFFKKMYNIDQTIYHLRANKSAHELRLRYYESKYQKSKTYLETQGNDLLRGSRIQYDQKYQQNMYNFYKYLNSAVILVDEVLQTFMTEAKGKAILNKQGVDVFKGHREEEELVEKIRKQREKDKKKKREKTSKEEKKRLERYKSAGRNPNGNAYSNGSIVGSTGAAGSTSDIVPTGDNAKVVELALQWAQTRGVGSSSPVKYSMERRGSDMGLKQYGDCSSFSRRIFLDAGKGDIGWTTAQQVTNSKGHFFTDRSQMQPGDCMYFTPTGSHAHSITLPNGQKGQVAHVAIYIGGTKMVDLSYGVGSIKVKDFSSGSDKNYVDNRFLAAVRF
ncbi:C40 family peptidase [Bacillus atrophaeus]|uniref:C40 family peptidase n=1 Tax=Bacillus atrophaeus TaxID=1452 RepID=UPI002E1E6350|nr:NlpC/P60 family protein [Bacillus atrophaeus]